ncbi:hypothetical protein [Anoxybacteroides rupiense]|uniref:hypothetical protein n=1 Tax=Anoxybacteroides rupiense TaxID=311460 RepID=UPI001F09073D|nr:hypothetical protein [Anoxybacillus rupiensis]
MRKKICFTLMAIFISASGCSQSNNSHESEQMHHGDQQQGVAHNEMHEHMSKENHAATQMVWKFAEKPLKSNEQAHLTIQIQDQKGNPVQDFEIQHEKQMHLIIVSSDLSYFDHLHPKYKGNGLFTTAVTFPSGGEYQLYADYVPKGGDPTVKNDDVVVQGEKAKAVPLQPDEHLTKVAEGKEITLSFDKLVAGQEATLTFRLKDEKSGKPIHLQPYLGAMGHVVIIRKGSYDYLHAHPIDEQDEGSEASFMVQFPKDGIYQVWAQFQHEGKVITVPFTVSVSS